MSELPAARITSGLIQGYENLVEQCQVYISLDARPAHFERLLENLREFQNDLELVRSKLVQTCTFLGTAAG